MCFYKALVEYLSEYALKSASNAYNYAAYILEGVFEEGESLIASNVLCAYE